MNDLGNLGTNSRFYSAASITVNLYLFLVKSGAELREKPRHDNAGHAYILHQHMTACYSICDHAPVAKGRKMRCCCLSQQGATMPSVAPKTRRYFRTTIAMISSLGRLCLSVTGTTSDNSVRGSHWKKHRY